MNFLSIGEVARRANVQPSALRYYERAGILPPVPRAGGRRRYDAGTVRMVQVLRFAQQAGFTLEEIKTLFSGAEEGMAFSEAWRSLAQAKLVELDEIVANAMRMRRAIELGLQCGCIRLEDCTAPERFAAAEESQDKAGEFEG